MFQLSFWLHAVGSQQPSRQASPRGLGANAQSAGWGGDESFGTFKLLIATWASKRAITSVHVPVNLLYKVIILGTLEVQVCIKR